MGLVLGGFVNWQEYVSVELRRQDPGCLQQTSHEWGKKTKPPHGAAAPLCGGSCGETQDSLRKIPRENPPTENLESILKLPTGNPGERVLFCDGRGYWSGAASEKQLLERMHGFSLEVLRQPQEVVGGGTGDWVGNLELGPLDLTEGVLPWEVKTQIRVQACSILQSPLSPLSLCVCEMSIPVATTQGQGQGQDAVRL